MVMVIVSVGRLVAVGTSVGRFATARKRSKSSRRAAPDEAASPSYFVEVFDNDNVNPRQYVGTDQSASWYMSEAEAVAFVVEKLGHWQVRPGRIYPGEFAKMLGMMGEGRG